MKRTACYFLTYPQMTLTPSLQRVRNGAPVCPHSEDIWTVKGLYPAPPLPPCASDLTDQVMMGAEEKFRHEPMLLLLLLLIRGPPESCSGLYQRTSDQQGVLGDWRALITKINRNKRFDQTINWVVNYRTDSALEDKWHAKILYRDRLCLFNWLHVLVWSFLEVDLFPNIHVSAQW